MLMHSESINRRVVLSLLAGSTAALAANKAFAANEVVTDDELIFDTPAVKSEGNIQLQAIGALGVGHIQSTLGLIGVIADSLSKDMYSLKQIEDLMNGTVNGLESPKRMLRRLQDMKISAEDIEFLDRMIGVFNALQREAKALAAFAKNRKPEDATQFEQARKSALKKLADLTHQDELAQPAQPQRNTAPKTNRSAVPGN
jgi:hypothetical protein